MRTESSATCVYPQGRGFCTSSASSQVTNKRAIMTFIYHENDPGTVSCGKLGGGEVYRINDCKLISLRGYSPDEEIGKVMGV